MHACMPPLSLLKNSLILSLVLLSLSPNPTTGTPLYTTYRDEPVVLDSRGNPVEPGAQYYTGVYLLQKIVVGVTRGPKLAEGRRCPLYAVSTPLGDMQNAQPVKFITADPSQTQIREWVDPVKIDSGLSGICRDGGVWRMTHDPASGGLVVVASGAFNVPESSFRLRRMDKHGLIPTYTINYCRHECRPLGTSPDFNGDFGWLGLPLDKQDDAAPLEVFFVKKTAASLAYNI